jgi:hypothetical protein
MSAQLVYVPPEGVMLVEVQVTAIEVTPKYHGLAGGQCAEVLSHVRFPKGAEVQLCMLDNASFIHTTH